MVRTVKKAAVAAELSVVIVFPSRAPSPLAHPGSLALGVTISFESGASTAGSERSI
jgi:hypothetical protein